MTLRMLVDGLHAEETRMVIADDDQLIEFDIESSFKKQNKGNIYLAKVTRVEPSLQAAFVEYGSGRQGFLPFSEIHPDYYQIPVADKQDLLAAQAAEREAEQRAMEEEIERHARRREQKHNDSSEAAAPDAAEDVVADGEAQEFADSQKDEDQNNESYQLNNTGIEQEVAVSEVIAEEVPNEEVSGQETSLVEEILPLPVENVDAASEHAEESADHGHIEEVRHEGGNPEDHIEELGSDDPLEERPKRQSHRRYKIQEVIKKNQIVLIQVIKEERGNKGASVTTYISLPGRYCVLMPNTNRGGGVSRKINDVKERRKLKDTIEGLEIKDGMSIIVRTAGLGRTKADITRDYTYLIKLWNKIREDTLAASAPALVHEEGNVIKRGLRDFYNNDVSDVIVSGEKAYETAKEFMKLIMPTHIKKIVQYEEKVPIFDKYGIERQLVSMNDPVVALESGGYIVINPTEALISIDVNSGRATGERNVEDTATRTNIDAAYEIARQLRLRDLAGLIVIDFIDMLDSRHRRQVERTLKDALKVDRAKIQVGRISPFGLLEMSRQRLRPSITEINMIECPTCKGMGHIRSADSSMVQLARAIENELAVAQEDGVKVAKVHVQASASLALYFLNHKRKRIAELEEQYNFELNVDVVHDLPPASFRIQLEDELGGKSRVVSSDDRDSGKLPQSRGDKSKRRNRNDRRDRNRNRNQQQQPRDNRPENDDQAEGDSPEVESINGADELESDNSEPRQQNGENGEGGERRRRRRNRRRGRGSRERRNEQRQHNSEFAGGSENSGDESRPAPEFHSTEEITSGSFAPSNERRPRPPRQPRQERPQSQDNVNSGEESQSGYQQKEVREYEHASSEQNGGDDNQGNRKGWWRKIIE